MKKVLSDREGNTQLKNSPHGAGICSIGVTHGTVSSEIFAPKKKTFYYRYGFPNITGINLNLETFGANKKSWDAWLPFQIDKLLLDGDYSTWDGDLTKQAIEHFYCD